MTIRFERRTVLEADVSSAFDVALDVDFHLKSMEDSDEQIVGGVEAGAMDLDDVVSWRARHFGIWWTMTSVITELDRPVMFVDEQSKGPFKTFHHRHRFESNDDGTTTMYDDIEFAAPFGPLGRIAERAVLGRYLPKLIDQRNQALVDHFRSD